MRSIVNADQYEGTFDFVGAPYVMFKNYVGQKDGKFVTAMTRRYQKT
jgi:hypothetical protein